MAKLKGVYPALVTPFKPDEQVDKEALEQIVGFLVEQGVHGFFVCGHTGEGIAMTVDERKSVAEVVMDAAPEKISVIAHVGAVTTLAATELARHASDIGAAAVASNAPPYYGRDWESTKLHYEMVAEATDLPFFAYNPLGSERVEELTSNISNFAGLKYTSFDLFELQHIKELRNGYLTVFSGRDEVFLPALVMKADGAIGSTLNFMPRLYVGVYKAYLNGQLQRARELQFKANRITKIALQYGLPATKEIMALRGMNCGHCRKPTKPMDDRERLELKTKLEEAGFLKGEEA